jgi:hypothetical protein
MGAFGRYLLRNGIRKGFLGGSRPWLVVAGVAAGWKVLQKLAGNDEKVVLSEVLQPGETMVIAHGREPR